MMTQVETICFIKTILRSRILCHVTAKMTCGLKSLTLVDLDVITVRMHKFECRLA